MEFNWTRFTKPMYCNMQEELALDECYGNIICGDLCFDVVVRYFEEDKPCVCLDCYVANEDTGYGYRNGMPYDYADGIVIDDISIPYTQFQIRAENFIARFINDNDRSYGDYSLMEKANVEESSWKFT